MTLLPGRAHRWRRASSVCAACVLIAASVALRAAAQPLETASAREPRSSIDDVTEPLLARVEAEEARDGPFSRNLIDLLASLGFAYQEYGDHDLARAILERALYLQRFNEGLFNLDQAPLLERLIESELGLGRAEEAAELQQRLLELARRNREDPRSAAIFRAAAEREMAYYERYLQGELPLVIAINDGNSAARMAQASIRRARRHYNEAIGVLFANVAEDRTVLAELAELEEELARTFYLEASHRRRSLFQGPTDPLYGQGVGSYRRRVGYASTTSSTAFDYARALVELADWSLLFSRNGTAVERYAEAFALLVEQRVPAASIEELFPSDRPVFLPAFVSSPLDASAVAGSTGHVDVDFEIGKYGQPRKVRVVAVSDDVAARESKAVLAAIARARYRPPPGPGAPSATEYRLRYSLADGSFTPRL